MFAGLLPSAKIRGMLTLLFLPILSLGSAGLGVGALLEEFAPDFGRTYQRSAPDTPLGSRIGLWNTHTPIAGLAIGTLLGAVLGLVLFLMARRNWPRPRLTLRGMLAVVAMSAIAIGLAEIKNRRTFHAQRIKLLNQIESAQYRAVYVAHASGKTDVENKQQKHFESIQLLKRLHEAAYASPWLFFQAVAPIHEPIDFAIELQRAEWAQEISNHSAKLRFIRERAALEAEAAALSNDPKEKSDHQRAEVMYRFQISQVSETLKNLEFRLISPPNEE